MAVTYSCSGDVLALELEGSYEPADILRQFQAALADPDCPPQVALLVDVSRSEVLAKRPVHEIARVALQLGPHAERIRGRCAVFAPSDVKFGLSQMGSVAADTVGVDVRVFRDRQSALDWLHAAPVR